MRAFEAGLVFLWLCWVCSGGRVYRVGLGGGRQIAWKVDYARETLTAQVTLPRDNDSRWFAVGFSDYGSLTDADMCLLHLHKTLQDTWTDDKGLWHIDESQDCKYFKIKSNGKETKFEFTRKFDTCDPRDYVIEGGTTHIVWAGGKGKIPRSVLLAEEHGMTRAELLKPDIDYGQAPEETQTFTVTSDKVHVPNKETMYWCHVHLLSEVFHSKHHIIRFEPTINEGNEDVVHHMELFHCEVEVSALVPFYRGPCDSAERPPLTQKCKKVLAAWAMGATPFTYPPEAGLPMGGKDFSLYVMLEIHYNNPELREGIIDSSGIKVEVTQQLREHDAGVIELGLEYIDKMAIPPEEHLFPLTGYCITECTEVSVPEKGIMVFGSQLHTHLTGVRVATKHVRAGYELEELNRDNHYSTHFQEIRTLKQPVHVLAGDALITTCWYDTSKRTNITLGGFAISDEMCVNYIYYYPKIDLEVCKSSISDSSLADYFDIVKRYEKQMTGSDLPISEAYKGIEWTPLRSAVLYQLYEESPIYMQCNRSSGERFPGNWEEMPITTIHTPLPSERRKCHFD